MKAPSAIELRADLNAQDDDGNGWSLLSDAADPKRIVPGAVILAGNPHAQASVRILTVDDEHQVHVANSDFG